MKKSGVNHHVKGSASYVVAHAIWQKSKGRRLSAIYKGERNPIKALRMAQIDLEMENYKVPAESPVDILKRLISEFRSKRGIELGIQEVKWVGWSEKNIKVIFEVKGEHRFKIWKSSCGPNYGHRLHFTPPYHPVMAGWKQVYLINGDTDAYIGEEIVSVYSPKDSRKKDGFGSTWSYIKHPFYAEGKTLGVEFSIPDCLTEAGYQALYKLLAASLNQDNSYVAVSGGFRPPYDMAGNVLRKKGLRFPAKTNRGAEHHCFWEYKTLEAERVLGQSLAPEWFYRENWPSIYADEKPSF